MSVSVFRRWAPVLLLLGSLVGCDHATKYVAKAELAGEPPHQLLGRVLDLRYAENTDMAFSLLRFIPERVRAPLLLGLGAVGILALSVLFYRSASAGLALRAATVLLLAGAAGNYLDRIVRGYVVDFIHVPHWPVFNVADIYLAVGGGLLLLSILRQRGLPPPAPESAWWLPAMRR